MLGLSPPRLSRGPPCSLAGYGLAGSPAFPFGGRWCAAWARLGQRARELWASPPAILAICRFPDAPISSAPYPDASDRWCGGEESELRVSLVGVSCVGTTTIGRILAERRGWPFFDLDDQIERHFRISIERLQARFLTSYDYRKECAVVLERIATANPDCAIALPPSALATYVHRVLTCRGDTPALDL